MVINDAAVTFTVPRATKARWVRESQRAGMTLAQWATRELEKSAPREWKAPPPEWAAGLSLRAAWCLVHADVSSKAEVRALIARPNYWLTIPNVSRRVVAEIEAWAR